MHAELRAFFSINCYWLALRSTSLKRVGLFTLLLLLWLLPAVRVEIFIHELGHVLSYYADGGTSFGIIINPLPHSPEGWAPGDMQISGASEEFLLSMGGTSAAALFGLLLLPLGSRLHPRSSVRIFIGLCTGIGFLYFLWYPLFSYYGGRGDFHNWPRLLGTAGQWLMPFLYLVCLPLGYAVGRWFFRTIEAWIPATSHHERVIQALLSVGVLFVVAIFSAPLIRGVSVTNPGIILVTGLGGLIAVWRMPLKYTETQSARAPKRAFMIPVCLLIGIEGSLFAIGGYIPMPLSSAVPPPSSIKYNDVKLASLTNLGFLTIDVDAKGNIYITDEYALYRYSPEGTNPKKIWEAPERMTFFRIKCHGDKVYMILQEKPAQENECWISSIAALDPESGQLDVRMKDLTKLHLLWDFDVDQKGDIIFAQKNYLMRLSPVSDKPIVIRDSMGTIMWIRIGPDGWIYLFQRGSKWPEKRDFSLLRVSADGQTMETLCEGLSFSMCMDVDAKGDVYLAGGPSVIELPAPGYKPVRLGGVGICGRPNLISGDRISYVSERNKRIQLRLLSPASN